MHSIKDTLMYMCFYGVISFWFLGLSTTVITFAEQESNPVHQLWQATISPPKDTQDSSIKNELARLIEQVQSIEISSPTITNTKPALETEPNIVLSHPRPPQQPKQKRPEPKLKGKSLTKQTLQILKDALQHPDQINEPLKLAEILFLCGYTKDAVVVYQEALRRINQDDANAVQTKAWVLFQIGNCLREDKPLKAIETYRKLIAEHPNSPWASLAKAQIKLIDWYYNNKPHQLITDSRSLIVLSPQQKQNPKKE